MIACTVAAAVLTVAPGADNLLVIHHVLRGGRRDGMGTAFVRRCSSDAMVSGAHLTV